MRAITGRDEIAEVYADFARVVSEGAAVVERVVGHKGVSKKAKLIWHKDLQLWAWLQPERHPERYWCAFGVDNLDEASRVSITCEINPPKAGIDRRCAGLFVRDERGIVSVAHSGKIGGGRRGISKTAFLEHWGHANVRSVSFPGDEEHEYIILGRISDPSFTVQLADFTSSVGRFKQVTAGAA